MNDDIIEYIRVYVSHAYHNLVDGDADIDYIHSELFKALNIIRDIKRQEVVETVNA